MRKVLIADACDVFPKVLSGALQPRYLVEVCRDGLAVLKSLRASRPDVLILDMMLPNVGGMDILKTVRDEHLCGSVILTGHFFSDYMLDSMRNYPVDFIMLKPFAVMAVVERVDDLCARTEPLEESRFDPRCTTSGMLMALGMRVHRKGFSYCRDIIPMLAEEPDLQLTKEVYPVVAKNHGTSKGAVEKAIRDAVDDAWSDRNNDLWRQYFLPGPGGIVPRPSNTQFLSRLAEALINSRSHTRYGSA